LSQSLPWFETENFVSRCELSIGNYMSMLCRCND